MLLLNQAARPSPQILPNPGVDAALSPDIPAFPRYINGAPGTCRAFGVGQDMTGTTRSSAGLDERRRRLLYRSWHRGTREMDLIMGRFADAVGRSVDGLNSRWTVS